MKKFGISLISAAGVLALTSCSLLTGKTWSWDESTKNDTLKYCLLIGQLDHNDSMYRTKGVREALGTRPKEEQKDNFNLEEPVKGQITLKGSKDGEVTEKTFNVEEIEHAEQKSLAGTTWDPITANNSASTWIAKHGKDITFFASNNDGMAEGAYMAPNWYKSMPIFGYDANASTLRLIKRGEIMGTIDSNTPTQCAVSSLLIRNIVDASKKIYKSEDGKTPYSRIEKIYYEGKDPLNESEEHKKGDKYNPTSEGFDEKPTKDGYYIFTPTDISSCKEVDPDNPGVGNENALLVENQAVTGAWDKGNLQFEDEGEEKTRFGVDINSYFEDGSDELKTKPEMAEEKEPMFYKGYKKPETKIDVLQTYYSNTDVFFSGNMDPYFDIFQSAMNLNVKKLRGDGTEEKNLINAVQSSGKHEAYLLNTVKQPNAGNYIDIIGDLLGAKPQDKWINRSDVPIIFWNRQPTNQHGVVSYDVMHNKRFKYTYYIGFGADAGGQAQGEMIADWLNEMYVKNSQE